MTKIADALTRAPRNFTMTQTLGNAVNLITAARNKLVANKASAIGELEGAAAELIKVIRALDPNHDLGISPILSGEISCAVAAEPTKAELAATISDIKAELERTRAGLSAERTRGELLEGQLKDALATIERAVDDAEVEAPKPAKSHKAKKPAPIEEPQA